ncbi:hypothetical protein G205_06628 [Arthrobacter nitrophenolicus]|uniref:Uncharacterized protein n=1 Tax=Arthrobacter nitrophenolicus TaxID=683150 RepID=L8TR52_9MICC|nr:hypothetical protein G205_06628 [Arthrobacter nitrophenolicus]
MPMNSQTSRPGACGFAAPAAMQVASPAPATPSDRIQRSRAALGCCLQSRQMRTPLRLTAIAGNRTA